MCERVVRLLREMAEAIRKLGDRTRVRALSRDAGDLDAGRQAHRAGARPHVTVIVPVIVVGWIAHL